MVYRKTEKVLADLEAVRNAIVASAIDIIRKSGLGALTMEAVKDRAKCSTGSLYSRFGDLDELMAVVTSTMLQRDLETMRALTGEPGHILAGAIGVLYARLQAPNLLRALMDQPAYRRGVRTELEKLIKATGIAGTTPKDRSLAAAAALGGIAGLIDVCDGSAALAPAVRLLVLRGIGLSEIAARRAVSA